MSDSLEKSQQLDAKQTELDQLTKQLDILTEENKRLDTELKGFDSSTFKNVVALFTNINRNLLGTRRFSVGKECLSSESSLFKRKNNILVDTSHSVEIEKGTLLSKNPFLNGGFQGMPAEREKVTEILKGLSADIFYFHFAFKSNYLHLIYCAMLFEDDFISFDGNERPKRYSTQPEFLINGKECAKSKLKG